MLAMGPVRQLDRRHFGPENDHVYARAAKRVRDWRREHELDQVTFARQARISVGCLQGFERAVRATRKHNLQKIAKAMGLSIDQLIADDGAAGPKPDPLLKDLRHEDKVVAQHFHHAGAETKYAIKSLLAPDLPDDVREAIARLMRMILEDDRLQVPDLQRMITERYGAPARRTGSRGEGRE
jgi:transcriptional regulator with XRE-family HTH domain